MEDKEYKQLRTITGKAILRAQKECVEEECAEFDDSFDDFLSRYSWHCSTDIKDLLDFCKRNEYDHWIDFLLHHGFIEEVINTYEPGDCFQDTRHSRYILMLVKESATTVSLIVIGGGCSGENWNHTIITPQNVYKVTDEEMKLLCEDWEDFEPVKIRISVNEE